MPWYRTGKVAITAGQNTVTGTDTAFSANARVGDAFQGPDGRWYEVSNIASATVLSILPAYQGATVAGGSYGLAPMQGYVKESADRLRQLVDQWGSTLAGLGAVSTENIVPVAKGGTGGNTAALGRAGLGLKSAAVADILGIVSQSGGIPTGAIIEFGSNANGDYYKFAGGLMICLGRINISGTSWSPSSTVGRYYSQPVGGAFAAAFAAVPRLFPSARDGAIGARSAWCSFISANATGVVEVYMSAMFGGSNQVDIPLDFVAVGRWHS